MKILISFVFLLVCASAISQSSSHNGAAKYVPANGKKLLIVGQDLGAVGGLNNYTTGYVDALNQTPAGVTSYVGLPGLNGLSNTANWGAGDVNASLYLDDATFDNSFIVFGLFINGQLGQIINGNRDFQLRILANWIKEADRPVFLRIGYEFDGPWNGLDPDDYKAAWIHIVELFDENDVRNVAYVWQSAGINTRNIDRWYPGDRYVNWMAYSHFDGPNPGLSIRNFAEARDKPIMIAESAPRRDLKTGDGQEHWDAWYAPLFETIDANERIKALAYINVNWEVQSLWTGQGWGDSRVQENDLVLQQWQDEVNQEKWVKASETLFEDLEYSFWQSQVVLSSQIGAPLIERQNIVIERGNRAWVFRTEHGPVDSSLLLYSLSGQLLIEESSRSHAVTIEEHDLPGGPFLIRLSNDRGTVQQLFYIKH